MHSACWNGYSHASRECTLRAKEKSLIIGTHGGFCGT
jgi:hypothetical protein